MPANPPRNAAGRNSIADYGFSRTPSDTIHRAVNPRIITVLGDATAEGPIEEQKVGAPKAISGTPVTDINLISGAINLIGRETLLGAKFAEVRYEHRQPVKQAQETVSCNANILGTIAKEVRDLVSNLPRPRGPRCVQQSVGRAAEGLWGGVA